jgi:hypothetical protein
VTDYGERERERWPVWYTMFIGTKQCFSLSFSDIEVEQEQLIMLCSHQKNVYRRMTDFLVDGLTPSKTSSRTENSSHTMTVVAFHLIVTSNSSDNSLTAMHQ